MKKARTNMRKDRTLPIVRAEELSKRVNGPAGQLTILNNVDLSISNGDAVAIFGVSGSGKSTLLGLLAGLDMPTSGRVILDSVDLSTLDEDGRARLRSQRVGFVFQTFQLLPGLTALENVMLPLELANYQDPREVGTEVLIRTGLGERLHHYPSQLSGGEQQRVAIARAFAPQPKLLFADEPTGNLDQKTGAQIIDLLFSLNQEYGTTLVLVTHDDAIAKRCHTRLTLNGGKLSHDTTQTP
jgi:putative ABC transport system ATP-binding protein